MKKSKVFILSLVLALFGSFSTFANTNPISNPNEIRQEIYDLISSIDVSEMEEDTERVNVEFLVNANNEIVVLNVSESSFDYNIKSRLNYHKVETSDVIRNKIYSVPVVFKKK